MEKRVRVAADENGSVICQSNNNPEYGYIRIVQSKKVIDDNNFVRIKEVSALLQGTIDDLKSLEHYKNEVIDGNIFTVESIYPFNLKNPQRDLKIAGKTGIVCTVGGAPIYRRTVYSVATNMGDTLIKHDNIEELREAYNKEAVSSSGNSEALSKAGEDSDAEFNI
jgi:hypothetical protein